MSKRLSLIASLLILAVIVGWAVRDTIGDLRRGGVQPCRRLDEKLCADLGAAACEIWKTRLGRAGSASGTPHRWRQNRTLSVDVIAHKLFGWDAAHADNPLCYQELADATYPAILNAVRTMVAAEDRSTQSTRATQAIRAAKP
jgi:hypothetical protein